MSRLNKTSEIIELIMLLQNSYCGLTIDEMAEKLERPRRAIERMKAILSDKFGDKLEEVTTTEKKKRWRFKKGSTNFLISFNSSDLICLEQLKALSNDNQQKQMDSIIAKIKILTPRNLSINDIDALIESQCFAIRQYPHEKSDINFLNKIQEGIIFRKKLKANYTTAQKDTYELILHPYGFLISSSLYLIAVEDGIQNPKLYKISRFKEIELLEDYFDKDNEFDLKKYSEKSFGVYNKEPQFIELLFSKEVREDILNYHFHPTQSMEEKENGDVSVKFQASGEEEICWELFKWGKYVKIEKPASLKEFYSDYLSQCLYNQRVLK